MWEENLKNDRQILGLQGEDGLLGDVGLPGQPGSSGEKGETGTDGFSVSDIFLLIFGFLFFSVLTIFHSKIRDCQDETVQMVEMVFLEHQV